MKNLWNKFKLWAGIEVPVQKIERDSIGRFIDPKAAPAVKVELAPATAGTKPTDIPKEKPSASSSKPKAKAAPATATVKKPRAKTPAKPRAPKVVAFDPNARDGDGDGIVQDGTIHARPATPKKKGTK
jgi:hypothetical protein